MDDSPRCGNCVWWDKDPSLLAEDDPFVAYGHCKMPVPKSLRTLYRGTVSERDGIGCPCYEMVPEIDHG